MGSRSNDVNRVVKGASPRFREAFAAVEGVVHDVFPDATSGIEARLPGWKVRIRDVPPPGFRGTFDPLHLVILLAERKEGTTLHIWNPVDYYYLEAKRTPLEAAGFKVMRGCLQFNRKAEFPAAAVEDLFRAIKTDLPPR